MSTIDPPTGYLLVAARALDRQLPRRIARPAHWMSWRLRHGNIDLFAGLCDRMSDDLFRYAYYRVGDRQTAEAVVSHICRVARSRRAELRKSGLGAGAWLMRIAREQVHEIYGRYIIDPVPADSDYHVLEALTRLEPDQQECLMLRLRLRFGASEIARIMGRTDDEQILLQANAITELKGLAA